MESSMLSKVILLVFIHVLTSDFQLEMEFYAEDQALRSISKTIKQKNPKITGSLKIGNISGREAPTRIYTFKYGESAPKYAIFTRAKGRHDYFDYLLVINANNEIELVRILKYRSEYGAQISSKRWLRQFEGYTSGQLNYGKDISALSGATISAMSITRDIPLVVEALKLYILSKKQSH